MLVMAQEQAPPGLMEAKDAARLFGPRYGVDPERFYRRMRNWWNRGLIYSTRPPKRRRPVYIKPAEIEYMMEVPHDEPPESVETSGGEQVEP